MKNRAFVLSITIPILMFAFASLSFAQSKETKNNNKIAKQEIQKKTDNQQLNKIQALGKTMDNKSNSNVKAGMAEYKGLNKNNTKTTAVNKVQNELKKTEINTEHHKKYHNKSIIKNQSKENANKQQKEKK